VASSDKGAIHFEEDWFDLKTRDIWERRLLPIKDDVDTYLEIGVAEGHSMRWICENLNPTRAVGVDPWVPPQEKQREAFKKYVVNAYANLKEFLDEGQVVLCAKPSQTFLSELFCGLDDALILTQGCDNNRFDLIYIDGDHHGPEALLDMLLCSQLLSRPKMERDGNRRWKMVKHGGRMIVDDLQRIYHSGKPLVLPAVQAYELIMKGRTARIWLDGRQICFEALVVRSDHHE
jgi:hypothetical protein